MNLYTKVISRFATSTNLKLRVAIEVSPDGAQADHVREQVQSALRDLGLNDDVRLS